MLTISARRRMALPAASLPAGVVGAWYADRYSTVPRPVLPNDASTQTVSLSVGPPPRHLFANTDFFFSQNAVAVDDNALAADGTRSASTITGTGNWYLATHISPPAGTYTVRCNVRSGTAGNASFVFKTYNSNQTSSVFTVGQQDQPISYTFPSPLADNGENIGFASSDGATDATLIVSDFAVYPGSSDLGPELPAGHAVLDYIHDKIPAVSNGYFDPTSQQGLSAVSQFAAPQNFSAWTVSAVALKTSASHNGVQSMMTGIKGNSSLNFVAGIDSQAAPCAYLAQNFLVGYSPAGLPHPFTGAPQVITDTYDGTTLRQYVNDVQVAAINAPNLTFNEASFRFGCFLGYIPAPVYKYHAFVFASRAWSKAEVASASQFLTARAQAKAGITVGCNRYLVAEGDSNTYGLTATDSQSYASLYAAVANPHVYGRVDAVVGATLSGSNSLNARAAALDASLPANRAGRKFILSVLIGKNDLPGYAGGATQYAADVGAYCLARANAGWIVALGTLPTASNVGYDTSRNAYNAIIRASGWAAAHGVSGIFDLGSDSRIGADGAAGTNNSNAPTTYFTDGTHYSDAGHAAALSIYAPVINAL